MPWLVIGLLTACFTLSFVDRNLLSILVEPVKASLQLSDTQLGILQGVSFSVFYVAVSLPLAWLADRCNRARLMSACIATWSLMTMLCGLSTSFGQLLAARIGVASGEAGLSPAALTMMSDRLAPRQLARATAIFMLAPVLGSFIALAGGGTLYAATLGWTLPVVPGIGVLERWQLVFLMIGAPGLLGALLVLLIRDPRQAPAKRKSGGVFGELFGFVRRDWRTAGLYMLVIANMGIMLAAYGAWAPAAIMRSHGIDERTVGLYWGPIYLLAGAAGTLLGGALAGSDDLVAERTVRVMRASAWALLPVALAAPVLPSLPAALLLMGGAIFLISIVNGLSSLPMQFMAPRGVRAQSIALQGLLAALFGLGLGPLLVGALSDLLPFANQSLGVALAILGAVIVPLKIVLLHLVVRNQKARLLAGRSQHANNSHYR